VVELVSIAEHSFKKYFNFPSHQYIPQKLVKTDCGVETFDKAELIIKDQFFKSRYHLRNPLFYYTTTVSFQITNQFLA
jgi:hypothetical protein